MRMFNAHFDGKVVVLDEPAADLKPDTRVTVIAETSEDTVDEFARISESSFATVWNNPLDADYEKL